MQIPKNINAFGLKYQIKLKKKVKDKYGSWAGLINHKKSKIELDSTCSKRNIEQAFFHELTHLIAVETDIKLTEHKIELISNGFYHILKDNKFIK